MWRKEISPPIEVKGRGRRNIDFMTELAELHDGTFKDLDALELRQEGIERRGLQAGIEHETGADPDHSADAIAIATHEHLCRNLRRGRRLSDRLDEID